MSKPKKLRAAWSKREKDMMFHYPTSAADGGALHYWVHHVRDSVNGKTMKEDLIERGYDWTTLRIEITLKAGEE